MLSYVVFDEAHCLSEWGSDYMPSYKKISLLNKIYGYVPRIAVTTTVTDKVVEDICEILTLRTPKVFRMSAQPISVHCSVQFIDQLSDPFEHLKNFIVKVLRFVNTIPCKMHEGNAIVYCRDAVTTELIRNKLTDIGLSTLVYDSKLKNAVRYNIEDMWMSGNAQVIITTHDYEFIHKKRIRCTAYFTIPENIPKYYRECTLMYTDKSRAYSRIYFSVEEYSFVRLFLKNDRERNEPKCIEGRLREYDKLVSYCLSINCRHKNIIKYFGDVIPPCKMNCDICKNKNVVEAKTHKFITRSKKVNGVIYNISTLNENLRNRQTSKNDKQIPMARDKLPQIDENPLPDESSQQLLIEIDEVAEIPRRGVAVGSSIRHANEDGDIKKGEKCRVSKGDSCEVIDVFNKPRKRSCAADACPEEFKSKMRKLESENKPPNETRKNRNEGAEDRNRQRVERIEGDANEGVTRDLGTADYLMNKYKLNKDSITLVPRRK